jgi:hypothetical protein
MKKIFTLFALAALVAGLSFVSCTKEEDTPEEQIVDNNGGHNNGNGNNGSDPAGFDDDPFLDFTVSKTAANKNVILEEYTGINCGYCPDGHRIANEIVASHPGRVFSINIHQGSFSANTYTTSFGDALAAQAGVNSYPSGTVNRHAFTPGAALCLQRSNWSARTVGQLNQQSCLNLAARCVIDTATRKMTVVVKGYYTARCDSSTNMLNVAILQNEVIGRQSGSSYNSQYVTSDGQYRHMHMLRHLITGQWGDVIDRTVARSSFSKVYEYTVPDKIEGVDAVLRNLDVVVFAAMGHKEIITGVEAEIKLK